MIGMPNHFHCIIEIVNVRAPLVGDQITQNDKQTTFPVGQPQGIAPTGSHINAQNENTGGPTIGDMMDAFKSITTVEYIRNVKNSDWQTFNGRLWQRNYYEHIIRNELSYQTISDYIINNPAKWAEDKFYRQ